MTEKEVKFKPIHVVLILGMLMLTAGLYIFKDSFLPNLNAPYQEKLSTYIETTATVISLENIAGRRGSRLGVNVQFRDQNDILTMARIDDNSLQFVSRGDNIKIFYNPENPKQAIHRIAK